MNCSIFIESILRKLSDAKSLFIKDVLRIGWINNGEFIVVTISTLGTYNTVQTGLHSSESTIKNWGGYYLTFLKEMPGRMQNRYVALLTFLALNALFVKINFWVCSFVAKKLEYTSYDNMNADDRFNRKCIIVPTLFALSILFNCVAFKLLQPSLAIWEIGIINIICVFSL